MLENNIVLRFVMAKHPRVFSFFYFFLRYHFFSLYQDTHVPLRFAWNYIKDKGESQNFVWNNSISTKYIKEERNYNLNPYLKLADGVSFCF